MYRNMRYFPVISFLFVMMLVAASCVNKVTCPAYQSTYYLDTAYLKKTYSLFIADSVPDEKIGIVKKTRYGISDEPAYRKKVRAMNSVEMVTIYPGYEDSIQMVREVADSTGMDSLSVATASTSQRIMFNYDQMLYNSLYGELLIPKKSGTVSDIKEDLEVDESIDADSTAGTKKSKFRLFKKKDRSTGDTEFEEQAEPQDQPPVQQEETEDDGF